MERVTRVSFFLLPFPFSLFPSLLVFLFSCFPLVLYFQQFIHKAIPAVHSIVACHSCVAPGAR